MIACDGGCVDGACVPVVVSSTPPVVEPVTPPNTPTSTPKQYTCTDTDGGKNYDVKGHLIGMMKQPIGYNDISMDNDDKCYDKNSLTEYYCYTENGTQYGGLETFFCDSVGKMCKDGACVTTTTPVTTSTIGLLPVYYPIFSFVDVGNTLVNGVENKIFAFGVAGTNNGNVAIKQLKFTLDVVDNVGTVNPYIQLSDFKLFRNGIDITSSVEFKKPGMGDNGFAMVAGKGAPFYIVWKSDGEDVMAGTKNTYLIKAKCVGFTTDNDNDFIRVRLDGDDVLELDKNKKINYLTPVSKGSTQNFIGLSDSTGGNVTWGGTTLVWSDRMSPVHSAAVGNPPVSSGDWFNGYYAKNLPTQYSVLVR